MAKKTIVLDEITDKDIEEVFSIIKKRFKDKIEKKGCFGFPDNLSGYSKAVEEMHETTLALHAKDWPHFIDEMIDVAVTAALVVASDNGKRHVSIK